MSSQPASVSPPLTLAAAVELLIAGRAGPSFLLDAGTDNVLGRSADALVVLPDRLASRMHAALRYDAGSDTWQLHDLGSRNGTWLDGNRVTSAAVADGAVIRVGTSELVFRRVAPADRAGWTDAAGRIVRSGPVGQFQGVALKRSAASNDGPRWPLLLYQAGIRMLAARTVRDVIGTSLELAAEHTGAASFGWFRTDADRLEPVCIVPPGCGLRELVTRDSVWRVIKDGQVVWLHTAADGGHPTATAHEIVCIPMTERQRGDVVLAAAAPAGSLRETDFDFLVALASLASAACAGRADTGRHAGGNFLEDDASLHTLPLDPLAEAPEGTLSLTAEAAAELLVRDPPTAAANERVGICVAGATTLRLEDWQRVLVIEALRRAGGSVPNAAVELGISRATLYRKLEAYGLTRSGG